MQEINFFVEDVDFKLEHSSQIKDWISKTIASAGSKYSVINYIICSDNYLLEINRTYLEHDYLTDIITFNNSDDPSEIEADIFVSIDRVKDNAENLGLPMSTELHRVLIHGVLHLLGWDDKTEEQQAQMREKEEACLSLLHI